MQLFDAGGLDGATAELYSAASSYLRANTGFCGERFVRAMVSFFNEHGTVDGTNALAVELVHRCFNKYCGSA